MKYKELYPEAVSGNGIISELALLPNIPWSVITEDIKSGMDVMYYLRSGFKEVIDTFSDLGAEYRVKAIAAFYGESWTKIWNDYKLEYSANDGYVLEEITTEANTITKNEEFTHGKITTETNENGGTVTVEESASSSGQSNIYGFNSTNSVPSDSDTSTDTATNTETRNLNATSSITNSGADSSTVIDTEDKTFNSRKHGNIGYVTPQQLIREDIELWAIPFFEKVFRDIDSAVMISVY